MARRRGVIHMTLALPPHDAPAYTLYVMGQGSNAGARASYGPRSSLPSMPRAEPAPARAYAVALPEP